jgi:hypothetical protein
VLSNSALEARKLPVLQVAVTCWFAAVTSMFRKLAGARRALDRIHVEADRT